MVRLVRLFFPPAGLAASSICRSHWLQQRSRLQHEFSSAPARKQTARARPKRPIHAIQQCLCCLATPALQIDIDLANLAAKNLNELLNQLPKSQTDLRRVFNHVCRTHEPSIENPNRKLLGDRQKKSNARHCSSTTFAGLLLCSELLII